MICDVSKWQGDIDWSKLAPVLDFVAIKASGKEKDPCFDRNAAEAVAHGVPWHAYHFLYCTTEARAKTEAKLFSDSVGRFTPLFWVLDCEGEWGVAKSKARKIAEVFEAELRRLRGAAIRVAVYIGHNVYKDYALDYDHYEYVWIPRYRKVDQGLPNGTRPDYKCHLWQYTSKGKAPGISGNVDLNMIIGDKPLEFFTGKTEPTKEVDTGMLTGKQLAEYCEKVYKAGWVYWYGTYGQKCSTSLYNSKRNQYPSHYTSARASGYKKDIQAGKRCADCVGMIKSFFWTGGKFDTDPKYGSNGCPDKSANGTIEYCSETGPIKTIPDEPGLVVWKSGHIGVYVGNGYTVEMKGFDYDCKRNKVTAGPWTKWGRLPKSMITYTGETADPVQSSESLPEGLSKGDHGSAVTALQILLTKWNPKCLPKYGIDGDFGSETEKAVKAFQAEDGLPVTGVYDEATRKALSEVTAAGKKQVVVTGDSVNVRTAPNTTTGRILGVVHKDYHLPYQGQDSDAGWHLIVYDGQNAWISGKYSKVV